MSVIPAQVLLVFAAAALGRARSISLWLARQAVPPGAVSPFEPQPLPADSQASF